MLYFAYGSNMLTRRLRAPVRAPSAHPLGVGWVEGRRLTFHKAGSDGSGKCEIAGRGEPGTRVHGVLFRLDPGDILPLDRVEGVGRGYEREPVTVQTADGPRSALTYLATRTDPSVRPYEWYHALVLTGAREHGLPDPHLELIRGVEVIRDPDRERRRLNESILRGGDDFREGSGPQEGPGS